MSGKKRVGIIGLGWLGESLAEFLVQNDFSVWGTVRSKEKAERITKNGIEVSLWQSSSPFSQELQKDLSKIDLLILNLPPSAFSNVSYAAGLSSFVQYLKNDAQVIFTSSTGVYPNTLADAREDYVHKPKETNKLFEAESVLIQQLGNRLCILRLAGLIGEDRNPVHYMAKKETNDNPDKKVNLIHRKDILKIILKVIHGNHFGEIFNLCHPEHPTRKEYYSRIAQEYNLAKIQFTQTEHDSTNKIVNCRKLQEVLNYRDFETL